MSIDTIDPVLRGLRRAICEEPEDDDLRLVAADRFEDLVEAERSEFIRVQCELWPLTQDGSQHLETAGHVRHCRRCQLSRRARELLSAPASDHDKADGWEGGSRGGHWGLRSFAALMEDDNPGTPEAGILYGSRLQWTWERGFIGAITLSEADFLRHASRLFGVEPITACTLSGKEPFDCGENGFIWFDSGRVQPAGDQVPESCNLHPDLCRLLFRDQTRGQSFSARDGAFGALSAAAVALGRLRAGLRPLEAKVTI